MANNKDKVSATKPKIGGAIWYAATDATMPTAADSTLGNGWTCVGYISEDGVKQTITRSNEQIKAWGGDVVSESQTEYSEEFEFTMIEFLNPNVLKIGYGDDAVTGTDLDTGISVASSSDELPEKAWVIEKVLKGNVAMRTVIPSAKVTEVGEIDYNDSTAAGLNVKLAAHPDASGKYHYDYFKSA